MIVFQIIITAILGILLMYIGFFHDRHKIEMFDEVNGIMTPTKHNKIFKGLVVLAIILSMVLAWAQWCIADSSSDEIGELKAGIKICNEENAKTQMEIKSIKNSIPAQFNYDSINQKIVTNTTYETQKIIRSIKQRYATNDDIYRIKKTFRDEKLPVDITYDMAEKEAMVYANSLYSEMTKIGYTNVKITPTQGGNTGMGNIPLFDTIELYNSDKDRVIMIHTATKTE